MMILDYLLFCFKAWSKSDFFYHYCEMCVYSNDWSCFI